MPQSEPTSCPTLMIQGTTSDAGKSTLVTGLCRILLRRGQRVVPFKPQNMALNSAVTTDGGEIGRAQAVQAQAAGLPPHSDMNPVLLKPASDTGAQVIIQGKVLSEMDATRFHQYKTTAMQAVLDSYRRLAQQYDAMLVEGAGSPAEINLREGDIANMGFAEQVDCPVILVADIDRGGVFAHLVGTLELLSASERQRIKGFVINRFRGDISLLQPGIDWLEQYTGKPVFGVLPYLHGFHLEAEDAINPQQVTGNIALKVVVPVLPRISNHTDFDVLRLHPQVDLQFIGADETRPQADLIILPGSKNVRADLNWLRQQGWQQHITRHLRYGGKLIGICGGFQMLGESIHDPLGLEDKPGSLDALGLFAMQTTIEQEKQLQQISGTLRFENAAVKGYEIHMGSSRGTALQNPAIQLGYKTDGAISSDGQILGTYLHGLFDSQQACNALLRWAGLVEPVSPDYAAIQEQEINRLADCMEKELDMAAIERVLEGN